jgi:hypothetical protein
MKAARFGFVVAAVLGGVLLGSGSASADCSGDCSVGGFGTGGQSSDGAAQGFHYVKPVPNVEGATVSNSGSQIGGNITVTGTVSGMAGGAYTPQGVVVGHYTGFVADFFGVPDPCNGICG